MFRKRVNNDDPDAPKIEVLIDNGYGDRNINLTIEFTAEHPNRFELRARDINGRQVGNLAAMVNRKDKLCKISGLGSFRDYCKPNDSAYSYKGLGTVLVYLCYQIATKHYGCIGLRCHAYNDALPFYNKIDMKIMEEYYNSDKPKSRLTMKEIELHHQLIMAGDPVGLGFEAVKLKLCTDDASVLINRGMKFVDNDTLTELLNSIQKSSQFKKTF